MTRSVTFTAYDPKTGAHLVSNVPVNAYEVSSAGVLNVTAASVGHTDRNGIVVFTGLDDAKKYDLVVQTIPFVHHNEFDLYNTISHSLLSGRTTAGAHPATANSATGVATNALLIADGANAAWATNITIPGTLNVTSSVTLSAGLNVGSATGAGAGDVKLSGLLSIVGVNSTQDYIFFSPGGTPGDGFKIAYDGATSPYPVTITMGNGRPFGLVGGDFSVGDGYKVGLEGVSGNTYIVRNGAAIEFWIDGALCGHVNAATGFVND